MADPKPATRRRNHGRSHSYLLDGEKVPGVTTILDATLPKPGLIKWAAEQPAEMVANTLQIRKLPGGEEIVVADQLIDELQEWNATRGNRAAKWSGRLPRLAVASVLSSIRYRDSGQASARGTEVHRLAAEITQGRSVRASKEAHPFVLTYVRWLKEWNLVEQLADALVEQVVLCRTHRYMGSYDLRIDIPGVFPGSHPWAGEPIGDTLIDLKTTRSGIFSEVALQLAGYGRAEATVDEDGTEHPQTPPARYAALHLRHDGYEMRFCDVTDGTWETFLRLREIARWLDRDDEMSPTRTIVLPATEPPIR